MLAEPTVVVLVGNTGVGKSSVGCRLLGVLPNKSPEKPFKVAMQAQAVTAELQSETGVWFGEGDSPLKVVDTPGRWSCHHSGPHHRSRLAARRRLNLQQRRSGHRVECKS